MPFFHSIHLTQFRNYTEQQFSFSKRIVAICGNNGCGKTNLLDAIYYLCFTKSYFSRPDSQSVQKGQAGFRIDGMADLGQENHRLICILRENNRKEFSVNQEQLKKFSQHIGQFTAVMIAPDDIELVIGGSEDRRKFIDTLLCQIDANYLSCLADYQKILLQRNSLLKAAAEQQRFDDTLLTIVDRQLAEKGQIIFEVRQQFLTDFIPQVKAAYLFIANVDDGLAMAYDSQLTNGLMSQLLADNRQRDIYLQRTGVGIHKDDLELTMNGLPFKQMASQGQRKSLLFALKLAAFNVLKKHKGYAPILLLDDVFEKLDQQRMHQLLQRVCIEEDGQVFITDTHKERLEAQLVAIGADFELMQL
jgi:DNA replication and repair protein RecF